MTTEEPRDITDVMLDALCMADQLLERFENGGDLFDTDEEREEIHATIAAAIQAGEAETQNLNPSWRR